ncbi:MAG TPA: methyltransferase domain-containing protein [Gemmatimonadaceae bacterium]|nr:methyltransferase domain-containing protein [Gemmatimonadaceae bacterium]
MTDLAAEIERRFRTTETVVDLERREVRMVHPANSDDLISEADFVKDERLPYWADLWPSAKMLARAMVDENGHGKRLLELGCGSGLVTVASAIAGYDVLASDYYADALLVTRFNVERNVPGASVRTREVDWRNWPKGLGRFDRVLAADVLYEPAHGELIARAIYKTLGDNGMATVADPGRISRQSFIDHATELGLEVDLSRKVKYEEGEIRQEITFIDLRWPLGRSGMSS